MSEQEGESSVSVGKYCEELNITSEVLQKLVSGEEIEGWMKLNCVFLVRGVVAELDRWCRNHKYSVKVIPSLLTKLFDVGDVDTENRAVRNRVERVVEKIRKEQRKRGKSSAENLAKAEREVFRLSHISRDQRQTVEGTGHEDICSDAPVGLLQRELQQMHSERDRLWDSVQRVCRERDEKHKDLTKTVDKLRSEVGRTRALQLSLRRSEKRNKDLEQRAEELIKAYKFAQASALEARYKCANRVVQRSAIARKKLVKNAKGAQTALKKTQEELQKCREALRVTDKELGDMSREVAQLKRQYKTVCSLMKRRNRQGKYSRKKSLKKLREKFNEESKKTRKELRAARKEARELKWRLGDEEEPNEKISFKKSKTYDTNIRGVYQDLLMKYGVSTANCEGVVRTVIENLIRLEVPKLPKKSTAANIYLEGRKLAQIQVAKSLAQDQNMTLASDATTKFGRHYNSYDVYAGEGSSGYMIGMRETDDGTAQTTLQTFKEILHDVVDKHEKETSNQSVKTVLSNIKNTMSDRHIVQKKFNELLRDYRQTVLPSVIQGWDSMSQGERDQFGNMNNFFCGLHFLVGLADYAGKTLAAWERMIWGDSKMGAAALDEVHTNGESGTERLVRNVCKSVHDRGCQQSGKPVQFRTFLKSRGISSVPLAPFKGKRFNILFHNGAGVAFLTEQLKEFFEIHKDDNLLMKSVHADLGISHFIAGTRALGLIDKFVTGPLWRLINDGRHIECMNECYRVMLECFSRWSNDCSEFMVGNDLMFKDMKVHPDEIYQSLVCPNPKLDAMTKQILELVFQTFCQVTENMLADHLPSGSLAGMSGEKMEETVSVPRSNVGVERDFGMLDRLIHLKPHASTLVYESIIMNVKNKTSDWRKGLTETEREKYMEYCRKSVAAQRKEHAQRVKTLWDNREAKQNDRKRKALEHEQKKKVRKIEVNSNVQSKCGGIWLTETEVESKLQGVSEKEGTEMLKAQLQARRYVFGEQNVQGNLNISVKGRKKSFPELKESLISIIIAATGKTDNVADRDDADDNNVPESGV